MKKMRFCSVCEKYAIDKLHCGRMALSAHPAPFNYSDPFGDYRRKHKGIAV